MDSDKLLDKKIQNNIKGVFLDANIENVLNSVKEHDKFRSRIEYENRISVLMGNGKELQYVILFPVENTNIQLEKLFNDFSSGGNLTAAVVTAYKSNKDLEANIGKEITEIKDKALSAVVESVNQLGD